MKIIKSQLGFTPEDWENAEKNGWKKFFYKGVKALKNSKTIFVPNYTKLS
jgi:hypothetical protein